MFSDLKRFKNICWITIRKTVKGTTTHEENGYWFRITETFYEYVMSIVE